MSVHKEVKKITTHVLSEMKQQNEKIAMLTGYDYSMAKILDKAGIDIILVGDSASNVMAGHETTLPITLNEMIYHASSVVRAIDRALVVIDLPFGSYQGNSKEALNSAIRIMKESGAHAIKMEGGDFVIESDGERPVIMLAGGIGITPLLAMAYEWLENAIRYRRDTPLMLISCQRDESEQLFDGELKALERSSGGIIRYVSVLSQPIGSPGNNPDYDFAGRLNVEILQHLLPLADYEFYLCGSACFMQNGYDILRVLGVDDNRIFAEAFGPSSLKRDVPESASEDAVATTAVVEFSRSGRTETWTPDDGTLLEFAESLGIEAEFSCRAGRCGSCRVDKSAGSVVHRDAHISPDNGVLLCCAKPAASDDLIDERLTLEL